MHANHGDNIHRICKAHERPCTVRLVTKCIRLWIWNKCRHSSENYDSRKKGSQHTTTQRKYDEHFTSKNIHNSMNATMSETWLPPPIALVPPKLTPKWHTIREPVHTLLFVHSFAAREMVRFSSRKKPTPDLMNMCLFAVVFSRAFFFFIQFEKKLSP